MFAVFEKSIAKAPEELHLSSVVGRPALKSRGEIADLYRSWRPESVLYSLSNGNFMALSNEVGTPLSSPRSIVVMDDIFCLFSGALDNTCDLRRFYGLPRLATEAMIIVEAYKVLRDRAPYPPDQVVKGLDGKFAFVLFDSRASVVFLARDRDGFVPLHWGTAADGSLICSDDPKLFSAVCGDCYTPFPPGCMFISGNGLISYDHPLHKIKSMTREDDAGNINAVIFQVDLYTRLPSIPRTGSAANWASAAAVMADEEL